MAPQFGDAPAAATLRADLIRALDGSLDVAARLARRTAPQPVAVRPRRPRCWWSTARREASSVIEVRAHDIPGLLYAVASALTTLGVSVTSARVHTLGADAVDVFYLQVRRRATRCPRPAAGRSRPRSPRRWPDSLQQAQAGRSVIPIRRNGRVEKITSTGTSKNSAIRSASYRLGLYSPRSR